MKKQLESLLLKVDPQFIYGFCFAIVIISLVLFSQYGYFFYYLQASGLRIIPFFGTDLSWLTAIWYAIMVMVFFSHLEFSDMPQRWWITFGLMLAFHGTYDALYLLKFNLTGEFLYGSHLITFPTLSNNIIAASRIVGCLILGYGISWKHLFFSKKALLGWVVFFGFWILWMSPALVLILNQAYSQEAIYAVSTWRIISEFPTDQSIVFLSYGPVLFQIINSLPLLLSVERKKGK